ncbi:hypothetical protein AVEN_103176-1 [Araneus ventricosus]|uniref:Uncharacterized protein n=1 Tax=Araneus ventricosus TaxID=182803 RepID=A0A4Y2FW13_ARAVE|nr:hypothetical protein AVEN_103176-1 [Araneus ventricosus]
MKYPSGQIQICADFYQLKRDLVICSQIVDFGSILVPRWVGVGWVHVNRPQEGYQNDPIDAHAFPPRNRLPHCVSLGTYKWVQMDQQTSYTFKKGKGKKTS